jgi:sulfur transfer complex TusBCD TusB component (DsrH family)
LGSENTVVPDINDMIAIPNDVLVLTSDGLTGALNDQEIMQTVNSAPTLKQACENLIHAAKLAGGMDNIPCPLIRFVACPWYQTFLRSLRSRGRRKWDRLHYYFFIELNETISLQVSPSNPVNSDNTVAPPYGLAQHNWQRQLLLHSRRCKLSRCKTN